MTFLKTAEFRYSKTRSLEGARNQYKQKKKEKGGKNKIQRLTSHQLNILELLFDSIFKHLSPFLLLMHIT